MKSKEKLLQKSSLPADQDLPAAPRPPLSRARLHEPARLGALDSQRGDTGRGGAGES